MPTTFIDGPAAGRGLALGRAPAYLRVTRDVAGKWDALDQITDTPRDDERVYVYALAAPPSGPTFICGRGQGSSGVFVQAVYRHVPLDDDLLDRLRDTDAWREWASQQPNPPDPFDPALSPPEPR